ncbi:MAG: FliI/YscN family ATPase [Sphingomonadaceae bacterium]
MSAELVQERAALLGDRISRWSPEAERSGRVMAFDGNLLTVEGLKAAVGALVRVDTGSGDIPAEAVGFRDSSLLLMALERGAVAPGARAWLDGRADTIATGLALLGRIVDGMGAALDGAGPIKSGLRWPLDGRPLAPLDRSEVTEPLTTGVRAIDALLTLGKGQRIGLIAGSGVGKSVLMQQLVRGAAADAVVVGLIGERGREIAGFVGDMDEQARARTHVVAVPADHAAPLRVRGAARAFAIAEALRHEGKHVLLLLDSLTRVAHAQRETGLAVGEPAGMKGYPASALALISRLVERAGNDRRTGGAITAVLTVLADGDDVVADPVVDTARGVLDGHIVLDRGIAGRGRFPAIDIASSLSRTMPACVAPTVVTAAAHLRRDYAQLEANRDLVAMGAYVPGQNPALDLALSREARMEAFLAQPRAEIAAFEASIAALQEGWKE